MDIDFLSSEFEDHSQRETSIDSNFPCPDTMDLVRKSLSCSRRAMLKHLRIRCHVDIQLEVMDCIHLWSLFRFRLTGHRNVPIQTVGCSKFCERNPLLDVKRREDRERRRRKQQGWRRRLQRACDYYRTLGRNRVRWRVSRWLKRS